MRSSFTISNAPWDFDYAIYFRHQNSHHGAPIVAYAQPVTMIQYQINEGLAHNPEPMLRCDKDTLQQLMDELWRVGLRPTEGAGSAGSLAATERHLADMRTLVFKEKPAP